MCPVLTVGHGLWSSQTPYQFCAPWWVVLCTTSCTIAYLLWAQIKITLAVLAVTLPCWLILSWHWKPRVFFFFATCASIQLHSFPCRIGTVGDLRSQSVELSALFSLAHYYTYLVRWSAVSPKTPWILVICLSFPLRLVWMLAWYSP